jgi:hypothetical protein
LRPEGKPARERRSVNGANSVQSLVPTPALRAPDACPRRTRLPERQRPVRRSRIPPVAGAPVGAVDASRLHARTLGGLCFRLDRSARLPCAPARGSSGADELRHWYGLHLSSPSALSAGHILANNLPLCAGCLVAAVNLRLWPRPAWILDPLLGGLLALNILLVGAALGAYGTPLLQLIAADTALELLAIGVAGAAYLQARRRAPMSVTAPRSPESRPSASLGRWRRSCSRSSATRRRFVSAVLCS